MALTDYLQIDHIATDGNEQEYTVPSGTTRLVIHPMGTAADLLVTSGGNTYNIADGGELALQDPNLAGKTLILNAASGSQDIEILVQKREMA